MLDIASMLGRLSIPFDSRLSFSGEATMRHPVRFTRLQQSIKAFDPVDAIAALGPLLSIGLTVGLIAWYCLK